MCDLIRRGVIFHATNLSGHYRVFAFMSGPKNRWTPRKVVIFVREAMKEMRGVRNSILNITRNWISSTWVVDIIKTACDLWLHARKISYYNFKLFGNRKSSGGTIILLDVNDLVPYLITPKQMANMESSPLELGEGNIYIFQMNDKEIGYYLW